MSLSNILLASIAPKFLLFFNSFFFFSCKGHYEVHSGEMFVWPFHSAGIMQSNLSPSLTEAWRLAHAFHSVLRHSHTHIRIAANDNTKCK